MYYAIDTVFGDCLLLSVLLALSGTGMYEQRRVSLVDICSNVATMHTRVPAFTLKKLSYILQDMYKLPDPEDACYLICTGIQLVKLYGSVESNQEAILRTATLAFICLRDMTTGTEALRRFAGVDESVFTSTWQTRCTLSCTNAARDPRAVFLAIDASTPPERLDAAALLYFNYMIVFSKQAYLNKVLETRPEDPEDPEDSDDQELARVVEDLMDTLDGDLAACVFREMVVTLRVPVSVAPPRYKMFMNKDVVKQCTLLHSDVMNHAYRAAMQGLKNVWFRGVLCENDSMQKIKDLVYLQQQQDVIDTQNNQRQNQLRAERDDTTSIFDKHAEWTIERTCVLLTALAVQIYSDASDARNNPAFYGCVELPCFIHPSDAYHSASAPLAFKSLRIVADGTDWICYQTNVGSSVQVLTKGSGLRGLAMACVKFISRIKS